MGKLINLAVYNPAILDNDEFLEGFVARQELTERLLSRLRDITPKNVARHLLLIGLRGMGKTSMLRRLALGVTTDPELSAVLIPLTFREEQYNVHNLHVFWCNCLDALGDYLEKKGARELAAELDREIEKLAAKGNDPDGTAACALFKEWCSKEGKRPLLLVDNIDLIFKGLKEQHQWGLRRILQERGGVVIVGASAGLMEEAITIDAPFYDFFQVHQLEKLSHPELLSCLRQIALKRGEAGARVLKVLDGDPARIHTLYDLTGGNPRTLVLLYLLLELDSEGDVMDDLERLLDQVTALYKSRVEDLAPQTRVVLDAVALAWNPVTVAQVAAETGLESTSISSQFDRLMKMGILEKVSLSTPAPTGYQLGERFFNIWYLMRNASRRMRNRLRWLTEFLRRLYTPQQLSSLADDFIKRSKERSRCSGVYGLALADALEDNTLRHAMNHHVTKVFQEQAEALCEQVDKYIDRNDLDQTTLTMAEMKKLVLECHRDWGNTSAEEFWDLLGGSLFFPADFKLNLASRLETVELKAIEFVVESNRDFNDDIKRRTGLPDAFDRLRQAVREGLLDSRSDFFHALAAAKEYDSPELLLIMIVLSGSDDLNLTTEMKQPLIETLQALFAQSENTLNSNCYYHWGRLLAYSELYTEAEKALRKSIELDPVNSNSWNGLGNLFSNNLKRYNDAEKAYRKAIKISPMNANHWYNFGILLSVHRNRYEEAAEAFLKATELKPNDSSMWFQLGLLLQFHLNRYDEAEQAYLKAAELNPKDASIWFNLGSLFLYNLNRYDEAEQAYRKNIELDPNAASWCQLGYLLQEHLNRYSEAEEAFRNAIKLDPKDVLPWINLGSLFQDNLSRYEEAEKAYRNAIDLDPKDSLPWYSLGNLLSDDLNRYDEAEFAYRNAIEISPENVDILNSLGNLLQDHQNRPEDAEASYRRSIELGDDGLLPRANLAYLLLAQPEKVKEAEMAYAEALPLLPEHGRQMLTAFRAIAKDNFGEAKDSLAKVLEENHPELFTVYNDDLLRLLRLAKKRGHGERLIAFLQESGLSERYWPLYAAFDAFLHGEERLRDVNPEVRGAAQRIFNWLNATPEAKEKKAKAMAGRKKGRKTTHNQ